MYHKTYPQILLSVFFPWGGIWAGWDPRWWASYLWFVQ